MLRMKNTPKTAEAANALAGTRWAIGNDERIITRVENAEISKYDNVTVFADIYWRKPDGKERSTPTALTQFRTWLNKAEQVDY